MRLIYSFITFVIALFFILLGIMTLLLPWSLSTREMVINFIEFNTWPWNFFGLGFLVIGLALIAHIWFSSRFRYYTVHIGPYSTSLSENVVDDYLRSYWQRLYPHTDIPYQFSFKKNKIQISVDLPYSPKDRQKEQIQQIEEDLSEMMRNFLGYRQNIELSISFEKQKPALPTTSTPKLK